MTPEETFAALRLTLPPAPRAVGIYKPCLVDGNHCCVSGTGLCCNRLKIYCMATG